MGIRTLRIIMRHQGWVYCLHVPEGSSRCIFLFYTSVVYRQPFLCPAYTWDAHSGIPFPGNARCHVMPCYRMPTPWAWRVQVPEERSLRGSIIITQYKYITSCAVDAFILCFYINCRSTTPTSYSTARDKTTRAPRPRVSSVVRCYDTIFDLPYDT